MTAKSVHGTEHPNNLIISNISNTANGIQVKISNDGSGAEKYAKVIVRSVISGHIEGTKSAYVDDMTEVDVPINMSGLFVVTLENDSVVLDRKLVAF